MKTENSVYRNGNKRRDDFMNSILFKSVVALLFLALSAQHRIAPAQSTKSGHAKKARVDGFGDSLPDGAMVRIGTTRFTHPSGVRYLDFTRDGKTLACLDNDNFMVLWDSKTGKELKRIQLKPTVTKFRIAPDGQRAFAVRIEIFRAILEVINLKTGKIIMPAPSIDLQAYSISPDGSRVAIAGYVRGGGKTANRVMVLNANNWKTVCSGYSNADSVSALAFSPRGRHLALGSYKAIAIADSESLKFNKLLKGHNHWITALAFSTNGKLLASADAKGSVILWDVATGKKIADWNGHKMSVFRLVCPPGGKTLISADTGGSIRIWNLKTAKVITKLATFGKERDFPFAVSPDGKFLVAGKIPRFRELPSGKESPFAVRAGGMAAFSDDGTKLITGEGPVVVWDVKQRQIRSVFAIERHSDYPIEYFRVHAGGDALIALKEDGTFQYWNLTTGMLIKKVKQFKDSFVMAPTPDGRFVAWERSGAIVLNGLPNKKPIRTFRQQPARKDPPGKFWSIRFAADGSRLAAITGDDPGPGLGISTGERNEPRGIYIWDTALPEAHSRIPQPKGGMNDIALSRDGRFLAGASYEGYLHVWEVASGRQLAKLRRMQQDGPTAIAFSPDPLTLAYSPKARVIQLRDLLTGKTTLELRGHRRGIRDLAISPDGKLLASAGDDLTTLVWRMPLVKNWRKANIQFKTKEAMWNALSESDPSRALAAIITLAKDDKSAAYLSKKLFPTPIEKQQIKLLIQQLDSDSFTKRTLSSRKLKEHFSRTEPMLRETLKKNLSLEHRLRINKILREIKPGSSQFRRMERAFMVLEYAGTKEAKDVLRRWIADSPRTRLSHIAVAALTRMLAGRIAKANSQR